ncbi:MAG: hypothetical protein JW924_03350 [Fusobacteriaceae bacterium]|nr:hypothetical protein [Fusobacteriaceae bacterium]
MKGDILAVKHYSWMGSRIRKATNCDYNHVAMFIDDEWIVEATFAGVKKTNIDDYIKRQKQNKLSLSIFRINDLTEKQLNLMCLFLEDQIGTKYDFIQLIVLWVFLVLGISRRLEPIDNSHKWICSELIAESAYNAGIRFSEKVDPDCTSPADILYSKKVKKL